MTFDFYKFSKDINSIQSQNDFSIYLESYFIELEEYLLNITNDDIENIKFDIEDILYDLLDNKLIQDKNSKIINAFLILLAEKFLQTSFIGAITIIFDYLPNGATKLRLEAAKLYLRVNDITTDYFDRLDQILNLLEESYTIVEYDSNSIKSFLYFYHTVENHFLRTNNQELAITFINNLNQKRDSYKFLQDNEISPFFQISDNFDIHNLLTEIKQLLEKITYNKNICKIDKSKISKENSMYTKELLKISNPTFDKIKNVSDTYIQSLENSEDLLHKLQKTETIIDDERLLYKYFESYGFRDKIKLFNAFDKIFDKIQNEKLNIINWNCGQSIATMLLLDYAKERNIILDIENITLIEASSLALNRGLAHIDILKQKDYEVNTINEELDCLSFEDLESDSNNKTLHLFSNIFDIESFSLNNEFFNKVASTLKNDALFVCLSSNKNEKLNNRLELFYKHFDENFNTELISSRETNINKFNRYEKIFEVKYTKPEIIENKRHEIKKIEEKYHLDIIKELAKYSNYTVPILNIKTLENSLISDPEYVIFKIRKVAEVITSKIYSKYETNSSIVSFNDKIRYLSYEKKVFDKTIISYLHTLRIIGNRGVHGYDRDLSKLKLDANLMIIALISFLNEINEWTKDIASNE